MNQTPMIIAKIDIQTISDNHFIGRLQNMKGENMKGMIVEAESKEDVKKELLTSFKVKIAYDYGLEISMIECAEINPEDIKNQLESESHKVDQLSITLV